MAFESYLPPHRERLLHRAESEAWRRAVEAGLLDRAREQGLTPPGYSSAAEAGAQQLRQINGERVRQLVQAGERDADKLLAQLGSWPTTWPEGLQPVIAFLGINLTWECDSRPRCRYCNQQPIASTVTIARWKELIAEAADSLPGEGPYVYLTGGEPLLLGEDVYGDQGLIRFAAEHKAPVNVNTNARRITPEVAVKLVQAGTVRLHISLDAADAAIQNALRGQPHAFDDILNGLWNVQVARELLGTNHPEVHVNCVVTTLNMRQFPDLLEFLLSMMRVGEGHFPAPAGAPLYRDLFPHLIPVGGESNADLRPSAAEWVRFYTETWAQADIVWQRQQERLGIPEDQRTRWQDFAFFTSPYHRVKHRGTLEDYAERAAQGIHWELGLCERCYIAPAQAFLLPDGQQHWCGAHAIQRPPPMGDVHEAGLRDNIRQHIGAMAQFPNRWCLNCAGATVFMNQSIEGALRKTISEWIAEVEGPGGAASTPPGAPSP